MLKQEIFVLYTLTFQGLILHAQTCGQVLATYLSISALSNAPDQGTISSCAGTGTFGYEYQCVEYIKRFYYQTLGDSTAINWTGNAVEYFASANADLINGSGQIYANNKHLNSYPNGSSNSPPQSNDILVFGGVGVGHVAIVQSVTTSQVNLIEQNWSSSGVVTLPLIQMSGQYFVPNRGHYVVLGWLRLPQAQIYSTFGPNDTFNFANADLVGGGGAFGNTGREWADPFMVSNSARVTGYLVAARATSGSKQALLSLWSGVSAPTTLLEQDLQVSLPSGFAVVNVTSLSSPLLEPGVTYWVSLRALDALRDFDAWQWSLPNPNLTRFTRLTGGPWVFGGSTVGDAFAVLGRIGQ